MAMKQIDVPILCIDIERFTDLDGIVAREVMLRLQKIAGDCGEFFSPVADPWSKWNRSGTGDGYYFAFDSLPPKAALKYALNMADALEKQENNIADAKHRFRLRMALVIGDIENIDDQVSCEAFGEAERFLSHKPVKQRLADNEAYSVIVMSGTFRVMCDKGDPRDSKVPDVELTADDWSPFKFADKEGHRHNGFTFWEKGSRTSQRTKRNRRRHHR